MNQKSLASLLALACLAAGAAHAQMTGPEQRIVAAVKQGSPKALELLEKSVRINSGTLNVEGVRAVGEVFRAELVDLGFETHWVEMPTDMHRAGHLVAHHEGSEGKRILLLGHLDTVFDANSTVPLWERQGDRVRGQGVSDMKGGDVIVIEALRALKNAGSLDHARIDIIFTGDEERTGAPLAVTREPMVKLAKQADYALSFEGSGRHEGIDRVSIARRSSTDWALHVQGRPGHSAGVFSPGSGYGAIYEGARILNAFRDQLIEPSLTFNVGAAVGGTDVNYSEATATGTAYGKTNVIARGFEARGDLRFISTEQGDRVKRHMQDIVAASLPGTQATITFRDSYPPMPATPAGQRLVELLSKVSQDAGFRPVTTADPASRGAGDIQFTAPYTTGVDGLGAAGSGAHTDDEDLEVASIERGAIRAALLIYRLTRPTPP